MAQSTHVKLRSRVRTPDSTGGEQTASCELINEQAQLLESLGERCEVWSPCELIAVQVQVLESLGELFEVWGPCELIAVQVQPLESLG